MIFFFVQLEPFENGVKVKFLPALIQTIKRLFMSINHIPKPGNKYFPEIVLGFDSAGGFPQMQGRDINIKTDHMTPGIVLFIFHCHSCY